MATQPSLSTTSNLPVQTHIPVPSLPPYNFKAPICAPLSSHLQFFDVTEYKYRPDQFVNGMKARIIY